MALLLLLDSEVDPMLQRHLRDTLNGLLTTLAEQQHALQGSVDYVS